MTSDVNYTDYLTFDEFRKEETIPEVLAVEDGSVAEEGRRGGNKKEKNKMMDEWQMLEEGKLLVRVHRRPRKGLFAPGSGDGCPVHVGRLAKSRETRGLQGRHPGGHP